MWFVLLTGLLAFPAADEKKLERYPRAELLIEATELAKPAVAQRFRLLDVRTPDQYRAGHIPSALTVDVTKWNQAFLAGADKKLWQERLGSLGIDADTPVVVYADDLRDAARIWWLLRYWGIRDVRLLHGGWQAWQKAGGQVQKTTDPAAGISQPRIAVQPERLSTKEQVLDSLKQKQVQILDVRSTKEYCGEMRTAKRNGAIPGAVHLEWSEVLAPESQRFKPPEELTKLFQAKGIDLNRPAVTYCQSGGRAAVMAFTLELMGAKDVRNYYRSWAEWGNAPDTPIVTPKP